MNQTDTPTVRSRVGCLLASIAVIWVVSMVGFANEQFAHSLGVEPRATDGLLGILTMALVHGSMEHLMGNSGPFLVLGGLIVVRGAKYFLLVSLAILLIAGIALWLFGRPSSHIGASALIFGFGGFLVVRAFAERSLRSVVVALAVIVLYGGMIFGILPQGGNISWEGHLFGLIAGGVVAHRAVRLARDAQVADADVPGTRNS